MPGVLIMNDENANGTQPGNQSRKHSVSAKPTITTPLLISQQQEQPLPTAPSESSQAAVLPSAAPSIDPPLVNGDHVAPQVDGTTDGRDGSLARTAADEERVSQVGKVPIPESVLVRPPEIDHITTGFQPMSKLIDRVTQECFNDLVDLITQLADEADQTPAGLVNGTSSSSAGQGSSGTGANDVARRIRMMEFANKHRERFVKLLVLLQWSRQVDDVSTMIDLWNWYRTQVGYHEEAAEWVGRLRISTSRAKQPNPDIQTALEVLSKGKASWISDLGYIPPKPLSPRKLLQILRNINSLLSVRLLCHENVPYLMRNWSVASGRVTFTVANEFELDLSLANEDPSSQLYFIDLRLLFSPTSDLPELYFRGFLENEVNKVLATTKLSGCYDFLHNFVLTHKLSILRRQAQAMVLGTWVKAIKVESVHRSLIVQYWLDSSAGTKNWIEIGIVSGKPSRTSTSAGNRKWSPVQTPRISVRWIRGGVDIQNVEHYLELSDISMEVILNKFIASHKDYILRGIQDGLKQRSDPSGRALRMDLRASETDPADCRLDMKLGVHGNDCSVVIDTFTGKLGFIPVLHVSPRLDQELNSIKNPAIDAHWSIGNMLCTDLHTSVERKAINYGWQGVRNIEARVEQGIDIFGHGFYKQSFFRGQGWCEKWAIAFTTGMHGVSWWATELCDDGSHMRIVRTAVSIRPPYIHPSENPMNLKFFRKLETIAVAIVSLYSFSRQLKRLSVPHTIRRQHYRQTLASVNNGSANPRQHQHTFPVMYIKLSALMQHRKRKLSLVSDFLRLTHQNYVIRKDGRITHVLTGIMTQTKRICDILTHTRDRDVVFHESGGFAIFLSASFGTPFVDQLVDRLERIERLADIVRTLDIWDLECRFVSLGRIVIRYYGGFYAEMDFQQRRKDGEGEDSNVDNREVPLPIRVRFEAKNPHRRVQAFLARLLTDRDSGVDDFACALSKTFPLLRALNTIENSNNNNARISPESSNATFSTNENTISAAKDFNNTSTTTSSRLVVPASYSSSTVPFRFPHNLSSLTIHARNFDWFRLSYANPRCNFDIRLRQAMEKVFWHVEETSKKEWYSNGTSTSNNNTNNTNNNKSSTNATNGTTKTSNNTTSNKPSTTTTTKATASGPAGAARLSTSNTTKSVNDNLPLRPESLTPALKQLFAQRGPDWIGMRKCVIAGVKGVEGFIEQLDEVVRGCAGALVDDIADGDGGETFGKNKGGVGGGGGGKETMKDISGAASAVGPSNPSNSTNQSGSWGAAGSTADREKEVVLIE